MIKKVLFTRKNITERVRDSVVKALFSSEKISDFGTVALSFVCDKYYLIMD